MRVNSSVEFGNEPCTFDRLKTRATPAVVKLAVAVSSATRCTYDWLQVIGKTFNWRAHEIAAAVDHDIGRILAKCRCINTKPTIEKLCKVVCDRVDT